MDTANPNLDVLLAEAGWVRALAHSLVRDPAAADDIVQDTWLAALRRPPDTSRPVRPWLARVVENFARMRQRGEASRERREESNARSEALGSTEELCARIETQRSLAKEVLALAEPFRSTVVLRYYEGLSAAEIARRVGAPSATVRWRLMRALELLRERLDARHDGDRQAWSLLLAPLAGGAAAKTAAKSAIGLGALVAKIAMLLALLLGLTWMWRAASGGGSSSAGPALPALVVDSPHRNAVAPSTDASARAELGPRGSEATSARGEVTRVVARIVDGELRPLAGAQLVAPLLGASATSGDDGSAALVLRAEHAVSRGLIAFESRAPGCVPAHVEARLARGADTFLGDIVLARAGSLEGFVGDDVGRPLAGARVRVEVIGSRWKNVSRPPLEEARYFEGLLDDAAIVLTTADGRYRFDTLPVSFVRVWASADGFKTAWSSDVAIIAAATAHAPDFALARPPAGERLSGIVVDPSGEPVADAELECARASLQAAFFRGERAVIHARADEHGRFDFGVDPLSHYDVAARDRAGAFAPAILLGASPGSIELAIRLGPVQRIAIRASDDSGQPIEGARAEFRTLSSGKVLELESARFRDGEGLAPYVDFALRVTAEGFAAADLGQFRRLQVPPQLEVVLHRASQFHGVVLGAAGVPLEGARVELLEALPRKRAQVAIGSVASGEPFTVSCSKQSANSVVSTDASGRFALDAPAAGAYFARVSAADLAPQTIGPLQLEDSTSIDRTFTLSSGGALEGRVVRRDGGDVTGTVVGASCGDGYVATARAGPDGEFRFEHLAERNWQVRCVARETAEEWGALDFEHVAPTTSPPSWDALVREGKVAQCEVVIDDSGLLFRGALEINGSLQGAWVAELASVANPRRAPVSCVLDPDGRFEMRVLDAGDYRLRISRITRTEPGIEIAATVPVGQIGRWECLLGGTGTLTVHSDAQPNEGTRFVARASTRIGESISFTGEAPLDERGFATFANWPSGTTTVRLDNDSGLPNAPEIEVVLGIGETRTVELKPN